MDHLMHTLKQGNAQHIMDSMDMKSERVIGFSDLDSK